MKGKSRKTKFIALTLLFLLVFSACSSAVESNTDNKSNVPTQSVVTQVPKTEIPDIDLPDIKIINDDTNVTPTIEPTIPATPAPTESPIDTNKPKLLELEVTDIFDWLYTGINETTNKISNTYVSLVGTDLNKYPDLQASLDRYKENSNITKSEIIENFENEVQYVKDNGTEEWFTGLSNISGALVTRADENYLGLFYEQDVNIGGAHPFAYHSGLNYDTKTGELITIYDIVTDIYAFVDLVDEKLKEAYPEYYDELMLDDFYSLKSDVKQYGLSDSLFSIKLTNEKITIYFDAYSLGYYALGEQIVDIYFDEAPELFTKKVTEKPLKYVLPTEDSPYSKSTLTLDKVDINSDGTRDEITVDIESTQDEYRYIEKYEINACGKSLTFEDYAFSHNKYIVWDTDRYYLYFYEYIEAMTTLNIIDLTAMEIVYQQDYLYEDLPHPDFIEYSDLENGHRDRCTYRPFIDPDDYIR